MNLSAGLHSIKNDHLAAIVTHLEMTAPKMTGAKAFPNGVTATRETLSLADYRSLFKDIGEEWLWISRLALSDAALSQIIHDPKVATWVIRRGASPIALIELDFREEGTCELAFFGMIKSEMGAGLGGSMMALAQSQAFATSISRLHVHTCTLDAPAALSFYQKTGFTAIKREIEIFEDPRINGSFSKTASSQVPIIR